MPARCFSATARRPAASDGDAGPPDAPNPDTWFDDMFAARRPISIGNPTMSRLDGFPVPVRLPPLGQGATEDGSGIAVVADDHQTALPFEIETWRTDGESLLWVRVDLEISFNRVWIYYDTFAVVNNDDPGSTFVDYHAAYHFRAGWGASDPVASATAAPPLVPDKLESTTSAVAGAFGSGVAITQNASGHFDALDELFTVDDGEALMIEMWFKTGPASGDGFFALYDSQVECRGYSLKLIGQTAGSLTADTNRLRARFVADPGNANCDAFASDVQTVPDLVTGGTWTHVAQVIDRGSGTHLLVVNGAEIGTVSGVATNGATSDAGFRLANDFELDAGVQYFDGDIDELRISSPPPDPIDWARATYQLGVPYPGEAGSSLIVVGSRQSRPSN